MRLEHSSFINPSALPKRSFGDKVADWLREFLPEEEAQEGGEKKVKNALIGLRRKTKEDTEAIEAARKKMEDKQNKNVLGAVKR